MARSVIVRPFGSSLRLDLLAAAFEIGGLDLVGLQQFAPAARKGDAAVDHHIAAMRELEGMKGVLLDQEDGELLLRVDGADGVEYPPGDERGEPERGLGEQQGA